MDSKNSSKCLVESECGDQTTFNFQMAETWDTYRKLVSGASYNRELQAFLRDPASKNEEEVQGRKDPDTKYQPCPFMHMCTQVHTHTHTHTYVSIDTQHIPHMFSKTWYRAWQARHTTGPI